MRADPPKLAQAAVRAAVGKAIQLLPETPLIAGGKSFGKSRFRGGERHTQVADSARSEAIARYDRDILLLEKHERELYGGIACPSHINKHEHAAFGR